MDADIMERLRRRARRLGADGAEAEDLAQDAVTALLEQQAQGRRIDAPVPYLMTTLRHARQARARVDARIAGWTEAEEPAVEDALTACLCREVLTAIEAMPDADRMLLRRVAEGQTEPRVLAEELGVPVGTVMSRLGRARARLRKRLGVSRMF